jgi:hypothetical protein
MTTNSPFDDNLADWLESGPTVAPAALFADIVRELPAVDHRRGGRMFAWTRHPILRMAQAAASVAAVVLIAGAGLFVLANRPGTSGTLAMPTASPTASPTAVPPSAPVAIVVPPATPTATAATEPPSGPGASATPKAPAAARTPGAPVACGPATVRAAITGWQGAMGSRIATVQLTNTSAAPCTIRSRPQLVDGRGRILIDSPAGASSATLTVKSGGRLRTLVEASNYCGPAPTAPVTVAFVLGVKDRVIASPASPHDRTVPPCNGAAVAAAIQMQQWAP